MSRMYRVELRDRPPSLPRRILGWAAVVAGAAMLVLPGPGLLALALGIILLGRRDPTLRRWAVGVRLRVRRLSQSEQRAVRCFGWWLRAHIHQGRLYIREQTHRHACGQPLSLGLRIWIVVTVAIAIASLGVTIYMFLF